jgi:hypothetical protein
VCTEQHTCCVVAEPMILNLRVKRCSHRTSQGGHQANVCNMAILSRVAFRTRGFSSQDLLYVHWSCTLRLNIDIYNRGSSEPRNPNGFKLSCTSCDVKQGVLDGSKGKANACLEATAAQDSIFPKRCRRSLQQAPSGYGICLRFLWPHCLLLFCVSEWPFLYHVMYACCFNPW